MFQLIQFATPSIIFGMDTINQIGQQAKKLGAGRALLVTGPNVKEAGILDKTLPYFKAESVTVEVKVQGRDTPEPATSVVEETAEVARKGNFDVIIGIGGGSPQGAKAVIPLSTHSFSGGYRKDLRPSFLGGRKDRRGRRILPR